MELDRIAVTTARAALPVAAEYRPTRTHRRWKAGIGLDACRFAVFRSPRTTATNAGHRCSPHHVIRFGTGGRTLVAPRIATLRDAVRAAVTGPARVIGSAARLLAGAWPKGVEPPLLVDNRGAPDISWIARLGTAATEGYGPPKPLYLRAPDAQPQDAAHLPRR
jgi:hypothetical protein